MKFFSAILIKLSEQDGALEELKKETEGMNHIIWSHSQAVQ